MSLQVYHEHAKMTSGRANDTSGRANDTSSHANSISSHVNSISGRTKMTREPALDSPSRCTNSTSGHAKNSRDHDLCTIVEPTSSSSLDLDDKENSNEKTHNHEEILMASVENQISLNSLDTTNRLKDAFIENSLDHTLFRVEDVANDNACFFRALANGLFYRSLSTTAEDILADLHKGVYGRHKRADEVYEHLEWGYAGEEQEKLTRMLQTTCYRWVSQNRDTILTIDPLDCSMTTAEFIEISYGIDYQVYINHYKDLENHYASGESGCLGTEDHWGGVVEQYLISHIFKIPILVVSSQKFDTKKNKVITGTIVNNRPHKGVRMKIYQISGMSHWYTDKPPVFLLWKKTKWGPHYLALYASDELETEDQCKQVISRT